MTRTRLISAAHGLAAAYALVLGGLGVVLVGEVALGVGQLGHEDLDRLARRGVAYFVGLLGLLAVVLARGAIRWFREGIYTFKTFVPIVAVIIFGTVGQIIDTLNGSFEWIGMWILSLAVLPLALLLAAARVGRAPA